MGVENDISSAVHSPRERGEVGKKEWRRGDRLGDSLILGEKGDGLERDGGSGTEVVDGSGGFLERGGGWRGREEWG